MRLLTQRHTRAHTDTDTHTHARTLGCWHTHDSKRFSQRPCVGLVIEGWQTDCRHCSLTSNVSVQNLTFMPSHALAVMHTRKNMHAWCTRMYPQTQQRSFPLISLPKLKDFEGLTQPGEHVHTRVFPSTKKWIQFHQPLLKRALWDAQTRFLCDLKTIPNISFSC